MQTEQLTWHYDGTTIELGADWSGQGPLVLLLPALSSISTRREMGPLQERLSTNYQTISIDWPGFGNRPRAHRDWRPKLYSDFLSYLTGSILPPVHAVIAAGHAATFALLHSCTHPGIFKRLVLIAPTLGLKPTKTCVAHRGRNWAPMSHYGQEQTFLGQASCPLYPQNIG